MKKIIQLDLQLRLASFSFLMCVFFIFQTFSNLTYAQSKIPSDSASMFEIEKLKYSAINKFNSNPEAAWKSLNRAFNLSQVNKLPAQQIEVTVLMGRLRFRESSKKTFIANSFYKKAIDLTQQYKLPGLEASILSEIALRYSSNIPPNDSSRLLIQKALQLVHNHPNDPAGATAFINLSTIHGSTNIDSALYYGKLALKWAAERTRPDIRVNAYKNLASLFSLKNNADSAIYYHTQALLLARRSEQPFREYELLRLSINPHSGVFIKDSIQAFYARWETLNRKTGGTPDSVNFIKDYADALTFIGHYPMALKTYFDILNISIQKRDSLAVANVAISVTDLYLLLEDYRMSNRYSFLAKKFSPDISFTSVFGDVYAALGYAYLRMPDSVRVFAERGMKTAEAFFLKRSNQVYGGVYNSLGVAYLEIGDFEKAYKYLHISHRYFKKINNDKLNLAESLYGLSLYHLKNHSQDSAVLYAQQLIKLNTSQGFLTRTTEACKIMEDYFKSLGQYDSAFYYQKIGFNNYRQLNNSENGKDVLRISLKEQQKVLELAAQQTLAKEKYRGNLKFFGVTGLLVFAVVVGALVISGSRQRKKAYDLLKKSQEEIIQQKNNVEASLREVKQFQSQLIQSEKMASLGELTAGIAHEIQNPLNFVNNFSEVNYELIDELKAESEKPKAEWDEVLIKDTLVNLKDNEQKIVHHGKRADAIVKSMLQHSRTSSGKKELTDINVLCDEYLRLSYHGLRAKDKSFNAKFETHLDPTLPKLNVIPQDIGRVLLNLINNAFYAVSEKSKVESQKSGSGYEPTVTVSTKNLGDKIEISVKDNGNGIPDSIKEKIFQPFFTTKPTGQGTGLGLSLSYDIVKAHSGEFKVSSTESKGCDFTIQLPNN